MPPLFVFGTLRHIPLLEAVLGDCAHLSLTPARLPGHMVHAVAEGPFPMIVEAPLAAAEGVRIEGLNEANYACLDYYESAFGYCLRDVTLDDGTTAQAYFPPLGTWTAQGPWQLADWEAQWAQMSVIAAREVMSYRGNKEPHEIAQMFPMIRARAWSALNAQNSRHGALTLDGSVRVEAFRRPYASYFALEEYDLRHDRFDGGDTPRVSRAVFRAPDATLVLPYDPYRDRVLLVEQMRMGPLARGDRHLWQLEPIAGRLDPGETPQDAARREAREEAGLELGELIPVAETYCSPGNSSEFYYIFAGIADLPDSSAGLGGLDEEHEDIRSHLLSFDMLMQMCDDLQFANAPLVMAAYWLARHRGTLRAAAGNR